MQRGMKALHINDESQVELVKHKAQSAEWEQRYKDLERSHYHSDKNPAALLVLVQRRLWWFLPLHNPFGLIPEELPERVLQAMQRGNLLLCHLLPCHWTEAEPALESRARIPESTHLCVLVLSVLRQTAPEPKKWKASALKVGPLSMVLGNGV